MYDVFHDKNIEVQVMFKNYVLCIHMYSYTYYTYIYMDI